MFRFKTPNLFICLSFSLQIFGATTIAIFDNKINLDHSFFQGRIYQNSQEILNSVDDDQNGFIDDILGWNFLTNTGHQFQSHEKQIFSQEVFDYYDLKAKKNLGTITETEELALKAISKDKDIMEQKKLFTKYAHGTHIACLASGYSHELENVNVKILPVTYLGDESEDSSHPDFNLKRFRPLSSVNPQEKIENVESYLKTYRTWLITKFNTSILYSKKHSKIINASWGQSAKSTSRFIEKIYFQEFRTKIPSEQLSNLTSSFMSELMIDGRQLLSNHSDVLFIFSAGNANSDNDQTPHYPSSIKLENTISIGALSPSDQRASFSNFGSNNVDFFYPGVAISSCTPDGTPLKINGTSQSAAQVSYIAAVISQKLEQRGISPSPVIIKDILIKTSINLAELKDLSLYASKISLVNVLNYFNQ